MIGFKILMKTSKARKLLGKQELKDKNVIIRKVGDEIRYEFKPKIFRGLKGRLLKAQLSLNAVKLRLMNDYPSLKIGVDYEVKELKELM